MQGNLLDRISLMEMLKHEPALVFGLVMIVLAIAYFLVYLPFLRDRFGTLRTIVFNALMLAILATTILYFLHLFGYIEFDVLSLDLGL